MKGSKAPRADIVRLISTGATLEEALSFVASHESVRAVIVQVTRSRCDAEIYEDDDAHPHDGIGRSPLLALRRAARVWRDKKGRS